MKVARLVVTHQDVERYHGSEPFKHLVSNSTLAQLVVQKTVNFQDAGSNPAGGAFSIFNGECSMRESVKLLSKNNHRG